MEGPQAGGVHAAGEQRAMGILFVNLIKSIFLVVIPVSLQARQNTKDIIALGFDVNKTFIFADMTYMGQVTAPDPPESRDCPRPDNPGHLYTIGHLSRYPKCVFAVSCLLPEHSEDSEVCHVQPGDNITALCA